MTGPSLCRSSKPPLCGRSDGAARLLPCDAQAAATNVRVMNEALVGIPADRMRMHVCWGNYPGPHHHDVALKDIIHIVLDAKPKYLSIEACNPGHGHEWEVFETVSLPEDKVLMPGVLDTTTSHIEHPRLIAQRLMNFVRLVGVDRVVACTDCGFSTAAGASRGMQHRTSVTRRPAHHLITPFWPLDPTRARCRGRRDERAH